MKLSLVLSESVNVGKNSFAYVDGFYQNVIGDSEFALKLVRNSKTYKTVDNMVLKLESACLNNQESDFVLTVYEDLFNLIDISLVKEYALKYGNKNPHEIEDLDFKFMSLFNPDKQYTEHTIELTVENFNELKKSLEVLDNTSAYKEIVIPSFLKAQLDDIYFRHKQAQKNNMNYNIELSCALAKVRLSAITQESVNQLKEAFIEEVKVKNSVGLTPSRSMTLRVVIKKE